MFLRKSTACLPLVFIVTAGCLQESDPDTITVTGSASIRVMPDRFKVNGYLYETNLDKDKLLKTVSDANDAILEGINEIEGLEEILITTSSLELEPVRESECVEDAPYDYRDKCPIVSYTATVGYNVTGSPADKAGNAVAKLIDLGAKSANITSYILADEAAAQNAAQAAAVANARDQANAMVRGAGARIGRITRMQSGEGFEVSDSLELGFGGSADEIVITGSRVREISVRPGPIEFDSEVTVAFEIIQDTE